MRRVDPRRWEWLAALVQGVAKTVRPDSRGRDGEEFSLFMVPVLMAVLEDAGRPEGRFGGKALPIGELGGELMLSRKTTTRYLKALARAGMIKGVVGWSRESIKSGGGVRRLPLEVIVRLELAEAYGKTQLSDAKKLGAAFGRLWLERQDYPGDVQGFDAYPIPWGRAKTGRVEEREVTDAPPEAREQPDPVPETRTALAQKIIDATAAGSKKTVDALKREAQQERRKQLDEFVASCADVWVTKRARHGFGTDAPAWAAKGQALPPKQRDERKALERIFGLYGGLISAVAWDYYLGSKRQTDVGGKLKFLPSHGYAQWSGDDKRPSVFDKHVNQIIQHVRQSGWLEKPDYLARIRAVFGGTLDVGPSNAPAGKVIDPTPKQETPRDQEATSPEAGGDSDVADDERLFGHR